MKITKVCSNEQGVTCLKDEEIEFETGFGSVTGTKMSKRFPATEFFYVTGTLEANQDLQKQHNPSIPMLFVYLAGKIKCTTENGNEKILNPGDVFLVTPTTGKGHKMEVLEELSYLPFLRILMNPFLFL